MAKVDMVKRAGVSEQGPLPVLVPTDPLAGSQWHLDAIDVKRAWDSYAGRDIRIGIVDDGFERTHPDLVGNYRTDLDYDARQRDSDAAAASGDNHGTAVAGVAAATMNNVGVVGIAWEADIVGLRIGYGSSGGVGQIAAVFDRLTGVDVANNSWGYGGYFTDDFASSTFQSAASELQAAVTSGRGGLGTVVVFAAGNSRASGDNVNYHDFQNSPYVIAVAATDSSGAIAGFSTPGAAVLVAAPGDAVLTTDRLGSAGYAGGDYVSVSGTSFAAPVVSGVAALMLEANPRLGYRDVQEILAYSAQQPAAGGSWFTNGAGDWNGGGLRFNDDYGFGLVDAHAAVRLAESWTEQSTQADRLVVTRTSDPSPNLAIPDGSGTLQNSIAVSGTAIEIDRVEVTLDISHTWIGDLTVTLVSPDGTQSVLVDRPGVSSSSSYGASQDNIRFTVDSVQFWGEDANGNWTLIVEDAVPGDTGSLNAWTLALLGDADTADDRYIYTDAYTTLGTETARRTLSDSGGTDTINLAAVTVASTLDLQPGSTSTVAGRSLAIPVGTVIENAILGDGDDRVTGNDAGNDLQGWRGADSLDGAAGDDTLFGGAGNDTLLGGQGTDRAIYTGARADYSVAWSADLSSFTVTDLRGGSPEGSDLLTGIETFVFGTQVFAATSLQDGTDVGAQTGTEGADTLNGTAGDDLLSGLGGNDRLNGFEGADTLDGGAGNDTMAGGQGNDVYVVDSTRDSLSESSNQGTDLVMASVTFTLVNNFENLTLTGSAAIDATGNGVANLLTGNGAANRLDGKAGADTMIGGDGDDTYVVDHVGDVVTELDGEGIDLVQSAVAYILPDFVENLTLTGSSGIAGTGNGLANRITGNAGSNVLTGGAGNDTIDGGQGTDEAVYSGAAAAYEISWSAGTARFTVVDLRGGSPDGTDILSGIESFRFADTVVSAASLQGGGGGGVGQTGTEGRDTLNGTSADDLLSALGGNDRLFGLAGADTLDGGTGNDTMAGGPGDDVYIVDSTRDSLSESGNQGTDLVMASVSFTLANNFENLTLIGSSAINATGNGVANLLTGNGAANRLDGKAGADTMIGGDGDDTYVVDHVGDVVTELDGEGIDLVQSAVAYILPDFVENLTLTGSSGIAGTGNGLANRITGNAGSNVLTGGAGNDTLIGGNGRDILQGGEGDDLFVYRSTGESRRGSNRDIIADFDAGDRIDLSAIDADSRTSGNQAFTFIGTDAFNRGAGQLRYMVSGDNLIIQIDTNRDRTADLEIQVNGVTTLDALDFVL